MKHLRPVVVILSLLPLTALGADPTTRPFRPFRPMERPMREEADWAKVEEFFKENSPRRYEAFQQMGDVGKSTARQMIFRRFAFVYSTIAPPQAREPREIVENRTRQIHLEDDIFGIKVDMAKTGADQEKFKSELRNKVEELIDTRLAEKELIVARLKQALDEQSKQIELARERRELSVKETYNAILSTDYIPGPGPGPGPMHRRGPGVPTAPASTGK